MPPFEEPNLDPGRAVVVHLGAEAGGGAARRQRDRRAVDRHDDRAADGRERLVPVGTGVTAPPPLPALPLSSPGVSRCRHPARAPGVRSPARAWWASSPRACVGVTSPRARSAWSRRRAASRPPRRARPPSRCHGRRPTGSQPTRCSSCHRRCRWRRWRPRRAQGPSRHRRRRQGHVAVGDDGVRWAWGAVSGSMGSSWGIDQEGHATVPVEVWSVLRDLGDELRRSSTSTRIRHSV